MKQTPSRKVNRERFDGALRYGHLQLAVAILGNAVISHHGRSYLVNEFQRGPFLVQLKVDGPYCASCKSFTDEHASLVRLYLARLGKHGLGA